MRILQINKFLKIVGGAETYMFQLSNSLSELGHEIKFWGMYDKDNTTHDFDNLLAENIDFNQQSIGQKFTSVYKTIYSSENKKKISIVLDEFKPDIVHIHNYNFQLTPSILPEIKKRGIKIVQTIHDSQMVCPYHRLYNFQKDTVCTKCVEGSFINCTIDKCFDGSTIKSMVGTLESVIYHNLNFYNKYIDIYISPSKFLKNLIEKRIHSNIEIIPNFTNGILQNDVKNNKNNYYTYYGRLSEEKGIIDLINLFKQLDLSLKIIGKGNLEAQIIEDIKGHNNIEFLGYKEGNELFQHIQNSKYIIQFSKGYENCPMTIIESFALNVPVIAYNHSGFRDLITDGVTGFLLDNNKNNMIDKLLEIDRIDVDSLKTNIKAYFDSNLSKEIHIKRILTIYENLLKN